MEIGEQKVDIGMDDKPVGNRGNSGFNSMLSSLQAVSKNIASERASRSIARAEQKRNELEKYGRMIIAEEFAGKYIRIYDKGYVRISGFVLRVNAEFERIRSVSTSADVAKKTALGRALMAGATMGQNLATPNMRGDVYFTIATDKKTHMLHLSPPTERGMKAMHKLSTAAQGVLEMNKTSPESLAPPLVSSDGTFPGHLATSGSVVDELNKLLELKNAGGISEEEFQILKSRILNGE